MASTKTIQDSVTWASVILKQQPLQVTNMEPGLTFANLVKQRVLGPPMRWRFNRATLSFSISSGGGCDYPVTVYDLGWIEKMWLVKADGTIDQLEGSEELAKTTTSGRPKTIAPVYDDNAGNVVFRTDFIPSAASSGTVYVDYQKKASLLTSYGDRWDPLPDEYGYIYNKLFLALAGNLINDARWQVWSQEGVSALLGAQQGLSAQAIAIFLMEWERTLQTLSRSQDLTKFGAAALTR